MIECPKEWARLELPWRRIELIDFLRELTDGTIVKGQNYDLDAVYHFFFDDTDLGDDPCSEIDFCLLDEAEVEIIKPIISLLESILNEVGDNNFGILNHTDWAKVPGLAGKTREMLLLKGMPSY